MLKKQIYPKTERIKLNSNKCYITEKLDGSNLVIFKREDKLYFAQRNNIICFDEIEEQKSILYKGLYQWIHDNFEELNIIRNDSAVCGEWLGMGCLKYPVDEFDKRFYMFAKANIDEDFNLNKMKYDHDLFIYPFETEVIPKCIGIVPQPYELKIIPSKEELDGMYQKYCSKVNRNVEGFVVNYNNQIQKYVRMKNGKLSEHHE